MLERDRELAREVVGKLTFSGAPTAEQAMENIFDEIIRRQKKCTHTYEDGEDALYVTSADKRKCRICGKVF